MAKITKGSRNVYADLGLPDAQSMLLKAGLAAEIGRIIRKRKLSQLRAADVLGISQPKLSNILRGHFRGVSEAKMIECLTRLGHDVKVEIRPARRSSDQGEVRVSHVAA
jgi:predicted XRE-type DNA-binding protein